MPRPHHQRNQRCVLFIVLLIGAHRYPLTTYFPVLNETARFLGLNIFATGFATGFLVPAARACLSQQFSRPP
jgi:hypothetical protein